MQVLSFERRWIAVKRSAQNRVNKCRQDDLCFACMEKFLPDEMRTRDVHLRCYHATFRAIKAGKTTEQERMAEGKLGESAARGRKPSNPVSVDLA